MYKVTKTGFWHVLLLLQWEDYRVTNGHINMSPRERLFPCNVKPSISGFLCRGKF